MPESLVNTKRRIATIRSTQKITKAMKLVASVKYQRWKKMYDENTTYFTAMTNNLTRAFSCIDLDCEKLPSVLTPNAGNKTLYVIVSSTLGLCGAYNYNLFKSIDSVIKENDELLLIGQKASVHYSNYKNKKNTDYLELLDKFSYSTVKKLRHYLIREYEKKTYSKIILVYTEYKNSLTFTPTLKTILPLDTENIEIDKKESLNPPIFEPNENEVFEQVIPHYLDASIYRNLLESEISELASRRNAMETATDAAEKIQAQLQLQYNKARQSAITQEITEVVAGANSGKEEN